MPSTYSSPAHSADRPWSLSCFLCLFKKRELKKTQNKTKENDVLSICNYCASAPPTPHGCGTFQHSVSELWGENKNKKTKLTRTTANKTQNNSRGSCFDSEVNSREEWRRCEPPAFRLLKICSTCIWPQSVSVVQLILSTPTQRQPGLRVHT